MGTVAEKRAHSILPPGPTGTLLGGNIQSFSRDRLGFLLNTAKEYGPLASFRAGPRRIFLASRPDLIEQVLVTDSKHYIKHFGTRAFRPLLGNGLLTSEGAFWQRQRKLVQPAFLNTRVPRYAPIMAELTEEMLQSWLPGKSVQIDFEFEALTSKIALKTLFNLDDLGDRQRFGDTLKLALDIMTERIFRFVKFPLWVPTPETLRLKRALAELDRSVHDLIAAGRARREVGDDLLSRLISARHEDGSTMGDAELRDETMTLFLAGYETTALTLAWTWYLLARHKRVEDKLVSEWERVLSGKTPSVEDISNLPYTSAVITESMRLFPPAYVIGREATTDLELGGYHVKRGYSVLMSQWVSHRDPKYFADPEAFIPERWENGFAKQLPKFAYYPFGGGKRICVGQSFALMEAMIVLPSVGQRYRFNLHPEAAIKVKPQITLMPANGIPTVLQPR
jgi:cytochrome P450